MKKNDVKNLENKYFAWNEYVIKEDYEFGVLMGNWEIFDTFEELETFVKDTGINNALLSIYVFETLDFNSSIEEKFEYLYETQSKKVVEKLKEVENFVKIKSKDFKELTRELYRIISILKTLKVELFNLYIFDSVYTAVPLLNEHNIKNQIEKNNYTYKDLVRAFESDVA